MYNTLRPISEKIPHELIMYKALLFSSARLSSSFCTQITIFYYLGHILCFTLHDYFESKCVPLIIIILIMGFHLDGLL